MKEIISLRKAKEKHFLCEDGTFKAFCYKDDIHYLDNGEYKEIDNTLIKQEDYYINKSNDFNVLFTSCVDKNLLYKILLKDKFLEVLLAEKKQDNNKIEVKNNEITYVNLLENVDFKYEIIGKKLKETIILNQNNYSQIRFILRTNLNLKLNNNVVYAYDNDTLIYKFESPFVYNDEKNLDFNLEYELNSYNDCYELILKFDKEKLNNVLFPIYIDPTISTDTKGEVYDTYIYPNDESVDRNNQDYLKIGVDSNNVIYRSLLKFDLPTIGPASQVVNATLYLTSHPTDWRYEDSFEDNADIVIHRMTSEWNETSANWNDLNDKYNSQIEACGKILRTSKILKDGNFILSLNTSNFDITNLARRWYSGTENNGIMLKFLKEVYNENMKEYYVYSKNNTASSNLGRDPRPYLEINYINQNGIIDTMNYENIDLLKGNLYINNFNGNITNIINLNSTIKSKLPINIKYVYNSNDIKLDGYKNGWRFNYEQFIEIILIGNNDYIKYVDETGKINYLKKGEDNLYTEDSGIYKAKFEEDCYIIENKLGVKFYFQSIDNKYKLKKIINEDNLETSITYADGKISVIKDCGNKEIKFFYNNNLIKIETESTTTLIYFENNKPIKIQYDNNSFEFSYNSNDLLSNIKGVNNVFYKLEYYSSLPYRISKIIRTIDNDTINLLEYFYKYNSTLITNALGKKNIYLFDNNGKLLGVQSNNKNNKLRDMIGYMQNSSNNNNIELSSTNRFVNNLLKNSSFEEDLVENIFSGGERTNLTAHIGEYSYKSTNIINITLIGLKSNQEYTLSGYIKNSSNVDIFINKVISTSSTLINTQIIPINDEFSRFSITFTFPNDYTSYIGISFEIYNLGTMYIDDIQLEEGNIANDYNMIENSSFLDGINGWDISELNTSSEQNYEIINVNEEEKALKFLNDPSKNITLSKTFKMKGHSGDVFRLSFIYKNEGVYDENHGLGIYGNLVNIQFFDENSEMGTCTYNINLNPHSEEWQFFTNSFVAENDFTSISINVFSQFEVNNLYLTNIMLSKESGTFKLEYDENEQVISYSSLNNGKNVINYNKDNQLIGIKTPSGRSIRYDYDNVVKNRCISILSPSGVSNEYKYDNNGNIIEETVKNIGEQEFKDNELYQIKLKGTDKFLDYCNNVFKFAENDCIYKYYKIIKDDENFVIKFNNLYLCYDNNNNNIILSNELTDNCKYIFRKNVNGSISILLSSNEELSLTASDDLLTINDFNNDNINQEFYLISPKTSLFIKNSYVYDNNQVQKIIDYSGQTYNYKYNSDGSIKEITKPNKIIQKFEYNNDKLLSHININNHYVGYEHNDLGLITKINTPTDNIKFVYDKFMNKTDILINDKILTHNEYDPIYNKLKKVSYSNGYEKNYIYDDYGKLKKIQNYDKTINYFYNNNGNISKKTYNNSLNEYFYDFANRLDKICSKNNNELLITNFKYNNDNQIVNINHSYNYKIRSEDIFYETLSKDSYEYEYNNDSNISKIVFPSGSLSYNYDGLGRIKTILLNNVSLSEYEYMSNGNKTTPIIKTYKTINNIYNLKYNELNNITDVYINGTKIFHYDYDDVNELIKEDNYLKNITYRYFYDQNGNMIFKRTYNLDSYDVLEKEIYEYKDNGGKNRISKFNDRDISYDELGNIIKFGSETYKWTNATELSEYVNGENHIYFEYNDDGKIISRKYNDVNKYFSYSNGKLVYENFNNNILHFIRDNNDNLIGFRYNNSYYYYLKDYNNNIIGIMNNNFEIIANYEYDSWGNIISITDNLGNNITDKNNIANINPYRYKSYYYDVDMKLYNLGKRYYSPILKRFISMDKNIGANQDILSYNLYLFVSNDPINKFDIDGEFFENIASKITEKFEKTKQKAKKGMKYAKQLFTNPKKFVSNIKKSFKSEVGVGLGLGTNLIAGSHKLPFSSEFYQDVNWNYDSVHNRIYDTTTFASSVGFSLGENVDMGVGIEINHEPHIKRELWQKDIHDNPYFPLPLMLENCDYKSVELSFGPSLSILDGNGSISKTDDFLGYQLSAHLGVGGHIKIGFDLSQWDFD